MYNTMEQLRIVWVHTVNPEAAKKLDSNANLSYFFTYYLSPITYHHKYLVIVFMAPHENQVAVWVEAVASTGKRLA